MLTWNTPLAYPVMLMKSIGKKSFESMGTIIGRSGDTTKRMLYSVSTYFQIYDSMALSTFKNTHTLYLMVDVTLLLKIHSQWMQGSGYFYSQKFGRRFNAYKLLISSLTDGKTTLPFRHRFLFDKKLVDEPQPSLTEITQELHTDARKLFPDKKIIIVVDGAFATKQLLQWGYDKQIAIETRMHSNRKVVYKEKSVSIRDIKQLVPRGKQMARTIEVTWHGIPLQLTAHRRVDKKGRETIVYQASTYVARPSIHVKTYKIRWNIEKPTRTAKQYLGLGDCFSVKLKTHEQHVGAVFLAYALLQLEQRRKRYRNPEQAFKAAKHKSYQFLIHSFYRRYGHFFPFYA